MLIKCKAEIEDTVPSHGKAGLIIALFLTENISHHVVTNGNYKLECLIEVKRYLFPLVAIVTLQLTARHKLFEPLVRRASIRLKLVARKIFTCPMC
jgi:hypothetical protein